MFIGIGMGISGGGGSVTPWYLSGGITPATCIAAYKPLGATDILSSYLNIVNPGTYDAAPGTAPTWDAVNGWKFLAANSQYLTTGIVPASDQTWSVVCKFTNVSASSYGGLVGNGTAAPQFCIEPYKPITNKRAYIHIAANSDGRTWSAAGIMAMAGRQGYFNGEKDGGLITAGSGGVQSPLLISTLESGNYFLTSYIQYLAIYNQTLSHANIIALTCAMDASIIGVLVFDGDSLTSGYLATAGEDYPQQLQDSLASPTTWIKNNFGVPAQTVVQMIADAATQIDPLISIPSLRRELVCWGGINDIGDHSDNTATVYANIVTYCTARRAAGWTVTVCTIIAADAATFTEAEDTVRLEVNALIVANWETFADRLCDLASNQFFDTRSDASNTTYYNADKVHLTDVGYGLIASLVKATIGLS